MTHEDLSREQHVEGSSDRTFGLVFAVTLFAIAGWPLLHGGAIRWWPMGAGTLFGVIALIKPALLAGVNQLWVKLGILLGKVVSPIALSILFYGVFTPLGFVARVKGKDALRLKFDPGADSYWMPREPPGHRPDSMTNQF